MMKVFSEESERGKSYLSASNGIITEVGSDFLELIGYEKNDIVGKLIEDIFVILKIDLSSEKSEIEYVNRCYLFTKEHEVRKVDVYSEDSLKDNIRTYYFTEKANYRIEKEMPLFERLCLDNILGVAVYSAPDKTLLKANQTYLNFFDSPYNKNETTYGKKVYEFIPSWTGSPSEKFWQEVLSTGETFHIDEYEFDYFERGITYWNGSLIPIYIEGVLEYVVEITTDITDQVLERKKLETQKKQFETIIDNFGDIVIMIDEKGNYINHDKYFTNYSKNYNNIFELFNVLECYNFDRKRLRIEETPTYRVASGETIKREYIIFKNGDIEEHYFVSGTPLYDTNGKFQMGILNYQDITKYANQSKVIEEQKEQLHAIIENMSDGLFTLSKEGEVSLLNDSAKDYFYIKSCKHKSGEETKFTTYYYLNGDKINTKDLPGHRVLRGEKVKNFILKAVRTDGSYYFDLSGSPIYDGEGNVSKAIVCTRDITERTKLEETIRKQRDETYKIFDTLNLPIIRLSYPDFKIIELTRDAYRFICSSVKVTIPSFEEIKGKNILNIIPNFSSILDVNKMKSQFNDGTSVHMRHLEGVIEGKNVYLNVIFQPFLDSKDNIVEIVVMAIDVTHEIIERQEIEKVMNLQDEFFSFIAHEFRTPLTTMSSALQLLDLVYYKEMTPNIKKYIKTIRRSTYQQLRLVNNLLDITRAESGYLKIHKMNYEIVSTTRAIIESIKPFALSKDLKLKFRSTFKEKRIAIDDEKYERILLNLISNAIKFTPNFKNISVTMTSNDGKLYLFIKDEGIGIPKDKLVTIFERFGQAGSRKGRASEGTGIGLYLVKLLVKSMNGNIQVQSEEGKGTTFIVSLPEEIVECDERETLHELADNRLVQSMQIEFSSIYSE